MNRCRTIALVLILCAFILSACHRKQPTSSVSQATETSATEDITISTFPPDASEPTTPLPTSPSTTIPMPTEPPLSQEDTFRLILDDRAIIPTTEYTWKVTCTPAVDDRGWGAQKYPHPFAITSYEKLQNSLASELYDLTYTDTLCKESFASVAEKYDEEFFNDHILLSFVVITQQNVLPEVVRVDTGNQILSDYGEFMNIIAYIGNVTDNPTNRQLYHVLIELPASYWNYGDEDFRCDGIDNVSGNNIWEIWGLN